ncbi:MAG: DEAD/DEAH box helicase [Chlorobi bacterium]|nr:DEAD/DEAH box helicase [Chlorobiota bacterium]
MEKLIIVITNKNKLGNILIPYIAEFTEKTSINLVEQAVPELITRNEYSFTEDEKVLIKKLYEINEKNIFRIFSREKTLKQFHDKLKPEFVLTHIRPYIEKYIYSIIKDLKNSDIPIYYKDPNYSNIYETDIIDFHKKPAKALFSFNLTGDSLNYSLKISIDDKTINLKNKDIIELSVNPAVLLISNQLYWFENIDTKKFKPFLVKDSVIIPERSIDSYMDSFVKKNIAEHNVIAEGFDITEKKVEPEIFLSLENDLALQPVLILKFNYDGTLFTGNKSTKYFIKHEKKEGRHLFTKLIRNSDKEREITETLKNLGLKEQNNDSFFTTGSGEPDIYSLISWLNENHEKLRNLNINIVQGTDRISYYTGSIKHKFEVTEEKDWFDIKSVVITDNFSIPFYKFRKNIIDKNPEYKLPDNTIFIIPREWFTLYSEILYHSTVEEKTLKLNKVFFNLLNFDKTPDESKYLKRLTDFIDSINSEADIPSTVKAGLRPYQKAGYSWLYMLYQNKFGGILADDMGLGKTLQTLTLLARIYTEHQKENSPGIPDNVQLDLFDDSASKFNKSGEPASLIVMPTSLIHNWYNEIRKFVPSFKVYIYAGGNRLKTKDIGKILRHYHIVLTTYGIVRNDIEYLKTYKFHHLILDESQYIKNPGSKTYKAISELNTKYRMVLTGTPIENSLSDLWAQMNFVNPGLLGNFNYFKKQFNTPITKHKNEDVENKLQRLISPFILRRTKEMVAKDLPPVTEQTVYCDMTPEQHSFYVREKSGVRNELLKIFDSPSKNSVLMLQALTRLRQIANHPALIDSSYSGTSGKFEQIMTGIEDIISEKHKVLVFSSFVKNLEIFEEQLINKNIRYSKLTGATSNREKVINEFKKDDDRRIFLISLKAGGVGLNLEVADYVFILDPWWNPASELQAISRAHRIGQTKNVFVYKFISVDTIEEKISDLQKKKQELADTFISAENLLKKLTKEEFKKLLS